ncbi:MAG: hypothetical protein HRU19_10940 [Pseudobacteriovorax sp.]|nr:hypothetical protein [Pseudobacteriovorax sp.]
MTMIWLTLKPKEIRYKEINNYENRTHVFIDLSPSLSIADRQQRNKLISSIYPQFSQSGFLTFSTSINLEPVSFRSEDDFLSYLNELKVQRVGTKLGDVLQKQLEIVGKIDRLVLISDEDKHSWSGFNWKVLEDKIEVLHGIVPSSDDKRNTYIQSVEPLKQVQKQETGWAVKISRNYDGETVGGSLSLAVGEKNIRARRWQIPVDLKSVEIPIRIPFDVLRENGAVFDSDILDWSISVDGPDAMKLDNSYKSYFKGFKKQVLLVSAVSGEMFLDDNVYHLSSALDILGFETQRIDKIQDEEELLDIPLWIIAESDTSVETYCPRILLQRFRNNARADSRGGLSSLPTIWLLPGSLSANWENLCHCYANLMENTGRLDRVPGYCKGLETRDQYINVLNSTGSLQIGGQTDDLLGALAYRRKRVDWGADLFAFTVPFRPSKRVGLTYDRIPTLTKTFLELSYLLGNENSEDGTIFPQIANFIPGGETSPSLSNIPRGESQLQEIAEDFLPPKWEQREGQSLMTKQGLREEEDPRDWITICVSLIIGFSLIEIVWIFSKRIISLGGGKAVLILIFCLPAFEGQTNASTRVNLVGFTYDDLSAQRLARDIAGRTSIELEPNLIQSNTIGEAEFREAWLWLADSTTFLSSGKLEEIKVWIRRGGFLVIEGVRSADSLKSFSLSSQGVWKPIPPDHEIMRSFHLLEALPPCRDLVWEGYHFDSRLAIISIPYGFMDSLLNRPSTDPCSRDMTRERSLKIFVNILMVALATDYKKDQIHLPEILKRLR